MLTYGAVPSSVAISGLGVVSALGCSTDAFRDRLLAGASGVRAATDIDTSACRSHLAAQVADFDPAKWVSPLKLRRMDGAGRMAVVATRIALEDARIEPREQGYDRIGVLLGTYSAGGGATEDYLTGLLRGGPTGAPALLFSSTVGNAPASLAALEHKLRGPNATISQKESSGLAAIAMGTSFIRERRAEVLVVGGVDAVFPVFYQVHDRFRVLSHDGGGDEGSRPFDRRRNGFVLGEGSFALVLEGDDAARARGGRIRGNVLGVGESSTIVPINAWPTDAEALERTMRLALDDAGVRPGEVGAVYASANSTMALDRVEARALSALFIGQDVAITSIKGALGEFGASGAAACAAAVVCGEAGLVPPIVGLEVPENEARTLALAQTAVPLRRPIVLVNSFASGGATCSVVLRVGS
jgi:3-oxoacyl-[acyl-carrier-protein] synthase II